MTLRLDTYPEAQIATQMLPQQTPATTPLLCCLLHTGTLPPSHQVEVQVEGMQQPGQQEGTQQVFSWQCSKGSEMSIHLKQQGRLAKSWRGWWQGDTTIAHTGTLPIQVYCAEVLQPAGLPLADAVSAGAPHAGSADQHNGNHHDDGVTVAVWEALLAPTNASPSATEDPAKDNDDLWEQACQDVLPEVAEEEEAVPRPEQEAREETIRQEEEEPRHEQLVEEPAPSRMQSSPTEQEPPTIQADAPPVVAPAGTILASFPATTVWSQTAHQEQETRLTELLATMPAQTILVDLRQHTPTPRRGPRSSNVSGPQKLGLSKDLLRNCYGGRYWDRGTTIQTARRLLSTRPPTWGRVVTNPDDPDGLEALITALTQGFSLVMLDGEGTYAESARAAVLTELCQRVANLTTGACS